MEQYQIVKIRELRDLIPNSSKWFCEKWHIPQQAYIESMESVSDDAAIPQWYVVLHNNEIIGGIGVIKNDFHNRKDLAPNVCALFVEKNYRRQGIAGELLNFVCSDMKMFGIDTLYLITDHTSFYEKYGWEFLCMVQGDGEADMTRMYMHRTH